MQSRFHARLLSGAALLALSVPAYAQDTMPPDTETPIETVIVIGSRQPEGSSQTIIEPRREGRLSTLPDLLGATPGVIIEANFGGIDHPRFAIRGSGLQRGTQPAGRGIELRLDGVPMTYADTSFDFVEWIDPLMFDQVSILRGGRGVQGGAVALGGIVDFRGTDGSGPPELIARGEAGSFEYRRGQLAAKGGEEVTGFGTLTWFSQDGFREHNEQEALRGYASMTARLAPEWTMRAAVLGSDSEVELPGPQTLAQIESGSTAAQPANVTGDWRRFSERARITAGVSYDVAGTTVDVDLGLMHTDTEFRRRDVLMDESLDVSMLGRWRQVIGATSFGLDLIYQSGDREQELFLNGGGTLPAFTGETGLQWADNTLKASRLTMQAVASVPLRDALTVDLVGGWSRHTREIEDDFSTTFRAAAEFDRDYEALSGLALLSYEATPDLTLFGALSHVMEPPTFDMLLINVAGMGSGAALVSGANPRRPIIVDLDDQQATTLEAGVKGSVGAIDVDVTLYRTWLDGEIVSTSDFVTQTVTSVGNADRTSRWGIEASLKAGLVEDFLLSGDRLALGLDWTWTDARFDNDPTFGDNHLPIIAANVVELALGYFEPGGLFGQVALTGVPEGGFADYANTVQADGHVTLGARLGYETERFLVFLEGRNLTDERYASTVITARNNLAGADAPAFAPGEPAAVTFGFELRF